MRNLDSRLSSALLLLVASATGCGASSTCETCTDAGRGDAGGSCGNAIVEPGEQCDDGNTVASDGCENDCSVTCNDVSQCDDGNACNGAEACNEHRCVSGTPLPDGAECGVGSVCRGGALCVLGGCGNGVVEGGERCDDGNAVAGDGCESDCTFTCEHTPATTQDWYIDCDNDGYSTTGLAPVQQCLEPAPSACGGGYTLHAPVAGDADCDDTRSDVRPGGHEVCDLADNDCNGAVDDVPDSTTFYRDVDSDGYGTASATTIACSVPSGYAAVAGDCNDAEPAAHPGAVELCNGMDENCDGSIDEGVTITGCYVDSDGDTWGEAALGPTCPGPGGGCPAGTASRGGDCGGRGVSPGDREICNSTDDDCDGTVDDGLHVRRVDVAPPVVACEVWQYGRDMACEQRMSTACGTVAAGDYCAMNAGFYIAAGGVITIGCVTAPYVRYDIMRWELTARHGGCDGSASEYNACQAAAHRYCIEAGYVTGYTFATGPGTYSLICFDSTQADVLGASWSDLDANDGAAEAYCAGPSRDGWWCARAADSWCRSRGYATGFGPMEYTASGTAVACIRSY